MCLVVPPVQLAVCYLAEVRAEHIAQWPLSADLHRNLRARWTNSCRVTQENLSGTDGITGLGIVDSQVGSVSSALLDDDALGSRPSGRVVGAAAGELRLVSQTA